MLYELYEFQMYNISSFIHHPVLLTTGALRNPHHLFLPSPTSLPSGTTLFFSWALRNSYDFLPMRWYWLLKSHSQGFTEQWEWSRKSLAILLPLNVFLQVAAALSVTPLTEMSGVSTQHYQPALTSSSRTQSHTSGGMGVGECGYVLEKILWFLTLL